MSLDPALESFANRLLKSELAAQRGTTQELYITALEKVAAKFNRKCPLPFEDRIQKAYHGFMQLHAPSLELDTMKEFSLGASEYPEEWRYLHPAESGLGKWLIEHADALATQLITGAREYNLDTLYRLELPAGVNGAFWIPPLRLIYTYNINEDNYIARFDLIGSVATNAG